MKGIVVIIDGKNITVRPDRVFASLNPRTKQHNINLSYTENNTLKCIQIFCGLEESGQLLLDIQEERITDLRKYKAQQMDP